MSRLKIENLPDDLEDVIRSAPAILSQERITKLTPLSLLFLLCANEAHGQDVQRLTGLSVQTLTVNTRAELQRRYAGTTPLTATEETSQVIDEAVSLAGGPNLTKVGQLLLAMLSLSTDAGQFLRENGVTERIVHQRMESQPSGMAPIVDRLTSDYGATVVQNTEPIHVTPSLETTAIRILAHLKQRARTSVVVTGFPGAGRHTLVRHAVQKILSGQLRNFERHSVRQLNWQAVEQLSRPSDELAELMRQLTDSILIIDDLTAQRVQICRQILEGSAPVIAITTAHEGKKFSEMLAGKANWVEVPKASHVELQSIIKAHLDHIRSFYNLTAQKIDDKATEMLIRFGSITGLELPGGAIHLLDLVASLDSLTGDRALTGNDIASHITAQTGVPMGALTRSEAEMLTRLPEILTQRVIGQDKAKQAVSTALIRARAKLKDPKKTIGVFAFIGPTGVGKTELAKALAEAMFDDEDAMTRIDMSEYQEPHTVARLIGAPPGYVGYDEGGQLTTAVQKRPFQVLLLDEIDKAHLAVYRVLLQVFDDGRLTDGQGRTVNFRNTIVIMTSNHGSALIQARIQAGDDFGQTSEEISNWFERSVPPEFYNRIDEVVVFSPHTKDDALQILNLQLSHMVEKTMREQHGIAITVTEAAKALLLHHGYSIEYGARPLKRAINRFVLTPLATFLLTQDSSHVRHIVIDKDPQGDQLTFTERR